MLSNPGGFEQSRKCNTSQTSKRSIEIKLNLNEEVGHLEEGKAKSQVVKTELM